MLFDGGLGDEQFVRRFRPLSPLENRRKHFSLPLGQLSRRGRRLDDIMDIDIIERKCLFVEHTLLYDAVFLFVYFHNDKRKLLSHMDIVEKNSPLRKREGGDLSATFHQKGLLPMEITLFSPYWGMKFRAFLLGVIQQRKQFRTGGNVQLGIDGRYMFFHGRLRNE